jgi:Methyltransferase domain
MEIAKKCWAVQKALNLWPIAEVMKFDDLRINTFYKLMRPFARWSRQKRMRSLTSVMNIKEGMSVLDLGGQTEIWENVSPSLNLTILNLPGCIDYNTPTHHRVRYVEGDACDIIDFEDRSFGLVFSNSVIEHVGSAERQARFASEARRCGRSYWIQTPSKWFPIEAHCGMPFWWFYPPTVRGYCMRKWRKKYPEWTKMVEGTTVLSKVHLINLFPEGTLLTETFLGLPKSYTVYFSEDDDE